MKKKEPKIDTKRLAEIIEKFALSKRDIAKTIGMHEATFKNKLNPSSSLYYFTDQEYAATLRAVSTMAISVLEFCKKEDKYISKLSITKK